MMGKNKMANIKYETIGNIRNWCYKLGNMKRGIGEFDLI